MESLEDCGRVVGGGATKLMLPKCGDNVNIEKNATFSIRTEIGNNSGIGVNAHFYGKVIIGDNVMIAPNVAIYTAGHPVHYEARNTMYEYGISVGYY